LVLCRFRGFQIGLAMGGAFLHFQKERRWKVQRLSVSKLSDPISHERLCRRWAQIPSSHKCADATGSTMGDRWQAYFDTDDELVSYCPECAERKFSEWRNRIRVISG
jgi:hypothetical protein